MSVLELEKFDAGVLRGEMNPVDEIDDGVVELIEHMEESMYAHNGVGLAAPQVGHPLRITVMDCSENRDGSQLVCMINPELEETDGQQEGHEGCLSLPGIWGDPNRDEFAKATYITPEGKEETIEREGLWARCIQHEIDHLNGTLFIDRLEGDQKARAEERFETLSEWVKNPLKRIKTGLSWEEYVDGDGKFARFNRDQYENLFLPSGYVEEFKQLDRTVHMVAITELANFESAFVMPVIARTCHEVEQLSLTVLPAGENEDVADYYVTYGQSETPIVVLFDEDYEEIGTWGPRPEDARKEISPGEEDVSASEQSERLKQFYRNRGVPAVLDELSALLN